MDQTTTAAGRDTNGVGSSAAGPTERAVDARTKRHLRVGWWSLLLFLSLGIALEAMHGFKLDLYLNVKNETRRLMWTLAHAHGTLLALVHIAFAFTLSISRGWSERSRSQASACLFAASVLLPLGFFLGGLVIHSGDPGLGILLVPPGAFVLWISVFMTARGSIS